MSAIIVPLEKKGVYLNFGDADQEEEKIAIQKIEDHDQESILNRYQWRILKISHHGSRNSTSEALLQKIQPTEVWISSGVSNFFGHPTQRVLRLLQNRFPVRRTDQIGSLQSAHTREEIP